MIVLTINDNDDNNNNINNKNNDTSVIGIKPVLSSPPLTIPKTRSNSNIRRVVPVPVPSSVSASEESMKTVPVQATNGHNVIQNRLKILCAGLFIVICTSINISVWTIRRQIENIEYEQTNNNYNVPVEYISQQTKQTNINIIINKNNNNNNNNNTNTERRNLKTSTIQQQTGDNNVNKVTNNTNYKKKKKQKQPFDPFSDIVFEKAEGTADNLTTNMPLYSSWHCVGTGIRTKGIQSDIESIQAIKERHRPNYVSRTCWYKNLYYKISDQTFHYFSSPIESNVRKHALMVPNNESALELFSRMELSIGHVEDLTKTKRLEKMGVKPWKPIFHTDEQPNNFVTMKPSTENIDHSNNELYFLLYQPYQSFNIGHFLLDDLFSLFSMLDLFNLYDNNNNNITSIPFFIENYNDKRKTNYNGPDPFWRCCPFYYQRWPKCLRTYKRTFAQLFNIETDHCSGDILRTGNWLRGQDSIGTYREHYEKHTCDDSNDPIMQKQQQQLNRLPFDNNDNNIEYVLLPNVLAGTGRLGFFSCEDDCSIGRGPQFYRFRNYLLNNLGLNTNTIPKGYITFSLPIGSSRPEQVHMFQEEIEQTKRMYGDDIVKVVDMATLTWEEQALLIQNTAIFFTNHGGGSLVSLFLQNGAAAFVYWVKVRRDHNFYESAGYFRTTWISEEERIHVDRTMALVEQELEKTSFLWPEMRTTFTTKNEELRPAL